MIMIEFTVYITKPDFVLEDETGECLILGWIHPLSMLLITMGAGTPIVIFAQKKLEHVTESSFLKQEYAKMKPFRGLILITSILTLSIPALYEFSYSM